MVEIGKLNRLKVVKEVDFGLYLDGGEFPDGSPDGSRSEILLPSRYIPKDTVVGDEIEVFIYHDSEDRIIATTERPYVMAGGFACLKVVAVSHAGAFLDWGLPKDLLVPFAEQKPRMEEGKRYVVRVYVDDDTQRIVGSARLDDFLYDESEDDFEVGEEVELFVANRSELGYKVIINDTYWGLLHHHEVVRDLRRGEKLTGFIKHIREDGKIDVCLHLKPSEKTDDVSQMILKHLKQQGGFIKLSDKSPPEEIRATFGVSKGQFKKAIGALYKNKMVSIDAEGIRQVDKKAAKGR